MNYWMFTVMYDGLPSLWPALVERGLAAQHYPLGWKNEVRNTNVLEQMRKGDAVLAALKAHRFAGYGVLKTDYFRGGESLDIKRESDTFEFQERAEVDWIALPLNRVPPYVDCGHLKAQGYNVDLNRGFCVRAMDERTFTKVREILDQAGALGMSVGDAVLPANLVQPQGMGKGAARSDWVEPAPQHADGVPVINPAVDDLSAEEGRELLRLHRTRERSRGLVARKKRSTLSEFGRLVCEACGFDFAAVYGPRGKEFAECHHTHPISQSAPGRRTQLSELAVVCANCHRMLHRKPWLSVSGLQKLVYSRRVSNSND